MADLAKRATDHEASRSPVVLVVEDELLLRTNVAEYLRDAGFIVIQASSADEARAALMAEPGIDVAFCDIQLPGAMDGIALAQWIGEHYGDLPVLLTSGKRKFTVSAPIACGGYIAKPYIYGSVERRIRALISERCAPPA